MIRGASKLLTSDPTMYYTNSIRKRVMYDTMVIAMLIVVIFRGAIIARLINNNYTREGVVVVIHASIEEVIIVDTTGNEWCFYEVDYEEGDTVIMTMDKNNTDNIIKNVTVNTY